MGFTHYAVLQRIRMLRYHSLVRKLPYTSFRRRIAFLMISFVFPNPSFSSDDPNDQVSTTTLSEHQSTIVKIYFASAREKITKLEIENSKLGKKFDFDTRSNPRFPYQLGAFGIDRRSHERVKSAGNGRRAGCRRRTSSCSAKISSPFSLLSFALLPSRALCVLIL